MNVLSRPGRAVAVVGAVVAVSATTLMAVVAGSAGAQEPGRCTDNVNVRAQPSIDAPIVAVCEAGTAVQVGETRNGFVRLIDLGGWSAQEFVSVDGAPPARPASRTPSRSDDAGSTSTTRADRDDDATPTTTSPRSRDGESAPSAPDGDAPRRVAPRDGDASGDGSAPRSGSAPRDGSTPTGPAGAGRPAEEPAEEPAGGTGEEGGGGTPLDGLLG